MDQSLQNVPKAMKEFSIQEVGSWVSKNIDECLGGKFEGEFFVEVLKWNMPI